MVFVSLYIPFSPSRTPETSEAKSRGAVRVQDNLIGENPFGCSKFPHHKPGTLVITAEAVLIPSFAANMGEPRSGSGEENAVIVLIESRTRKRRNIGRVKGRQVCLNI